MEEAQHYCRQTRKAALYRCPRTFLVQKLCRLLRVILEAYNLFQNDRRIRHAGGVPVEIFKKLSVQSRKWFFAAAKTHKSVCPRRVTIWERQLATPGLFPSEFSRWGLENAPVQCATTAFSALLHTPGPVLFAKGCKFAEKFQSAAGINSQQFLGSLQFHFKSIAILFENGLYECRGSSVAPALCDIWQTV